MTRTTYARSLAVAVTAAVLAIPAGATASRVQGGVSFTTDSTPASTTGSPLAPSSDARPTVPGDTAVRLKDGRAAAPEQAPPEVQNAIWAANKIIRKPYRYGGGHARFNDTGYDCSGTISFALKGAKALKSPLNSTGFMSWGLAGKGEWITVYTHRSHAFVVIAGLRLDTSRAGDPGGQKGPRWRPLSRTLKGFTVRHPDGL